MNGLLPRTLLVGLALCLVLAVNGYPLVFPDSGTYLRQALRLEGALDRPPFYSLFLIPLHLTLTLWAVPVVQDLLSAALVLRVLPIAFPGASTGRLTGAAALAAVTTSWPFFSNQIMPDIFTPMIVLLTYCLSIGYARLSRPERVLMPVVLAAFCAFHFANPLFTVALAAVALLSGWWVGFSRRMLVRTALLIVGPAVAALLAQSVYGYAVIGRVTPAPYRSVFLLARLLDDGPARQFLRDECPGAGFMLCRELATMKGDSGTLLWSSDSAIARLVLERGPQAAIAEATAIVDGAIRAYPLQVLGHAIGNAALQFVQATTTDTDCPCVDMKIGRVVTEFFPGEKAAFAASRQNLAKLPWQAIGYAHGIVVAVSALILAWVVLLRRSWLAGGPGLLLAFIVAALVANAGLMGGLSAVADRYQARLIWLVPLFAFALVLARGLVRPTAPLSKLPDSNT